MQVEAKYKEKQENGIWDYSMDHDCITALNNPLADIFRRTILKPFFNFHHRFDYSAHLSLIYMHDLILNYSLEHIKIIHKHIIISILEEPQASC